jgi:hypothetical protein
VSYLLSAAPRNGFDFAHPPPLCDHKVLGLAFCRRRLRKKWALTEKARRRVYCTGFRASWSELAYLCQAIVCFRNRAPLAVRGLGGCNKRRRPRKCVIWRAGGVRSGRQARRQCREKGFSFSELARRPAQLPQPRPACLEGGGVVSLCTPIASPHRPSIAPQAQKFWWPVRHARQKKPKAARPSQAA